MTPRLITFYEGADYARMARVLAYTAAQHCPQWDRRILDAALFTQGETTVHQRVKLDTAKLLKWCEAVDEAPDGTPMLLADADLMICRTLDDLWDRPFDVAVTMRDPKRTRLPLNAGVIFVRATPQTRAFLHAWYTTTQPLRQSVERTKWAIQHFGACDQAGLGTLLKTPLVKTVDLVRLPCQEWNCEDSEWGRFNAKTRIVHIKGALRQAVLGQKMKEKWASTVRPLAAQWKTHEQTVSV